MSINDIGIIIPTGLTNGGALLLTGSLVTVHTVAANQTEEVFLWANNPTAAAIDVTLSFGTAGTVIPIVSVPPKSTYLILPGVRMTAAAATVLQMKGSGCYAFGNVNRVS